MQKTFMHKTDIKFNLLIDENEE